MFKKMEVNGIELLIYTGNPHVLDGIITRPELVDLGVIFDFDGVITNSDKTFINVYQDMYRDYIECDKVKVPLWYELYYHNYNDLIHYEDNMIEKIYSSPLFFNNVCINCDSNGYSSIDLIKELIESGKVPFVGIATKGWVANLENKIDFLYKQLGSMSNIIFIGDTNVNSNKSYLNGKILIDDTHWNFEGASGVKNCILYKHGNVDLERNYVDTYETEITMSGLRDKIFKILDGVK